LTGDDEEEDGGAGMGLGAESIITKSLLSDLYTEAAKLKSMSVMNQVQISNLMFLVINLCFNDQYKAGPVVKHCHEMIPIDLLRANSRRAYCILNWCITCLLFR